MGRNGNFWEIARSRHALRASSIPSILLSKSTGAFGISETNSASTITGRAARRDYQWRSAFCSNRIRVAKMQKKSFAEGICHRGRAAQRGDESVARADQKMLSSQGMWIHAQITSSNLSPMHPPLHRLLLTVVP